MYFWGIVEVNHVSSPVLLLMESYFLFYFYFFQRTLLYLSKHKYNKTYITIVPHKTTQDEKYVQERSTENKTNSIRLFNSLPKSIRDITNCSVCSFKQRLDYYLNSIPVLPCSPGYNNSLDGGDCIQRWTLRDDLVAG